MFSVIQLIIKKLKTKAIIRWIPEVLILAGLLWLFFILAGRALCHIALGQIAELTNTKIETGSVDFHIDSSVFIKKFIISPNKEPGSDNPILKAEKVYARFSLSSLFLLRPRLKVIEFDDFIFNAQYDLETGRWNLSELKIRPPKGGPSKMPRVHLKAGILKYSKISNEKVEVALSVPLNAKFGYDEKTQKGYSFDITTATTTSGFGKSRLTGAWKSGSVTLTGGISSFDAPELEMVWMIDVLAAELTYDRSNAFSLKLRIKDLHSKRSPQLDNLVRISPPSLTKSTLFAALQRFFSRYSPKGRVDIELDVSGNLNQLSESTLSGKLYCKDVAFCYYRFPYTIEHLFGHLYLTKNSIVMDNLCGKHGNATLFFNGWSRDFGPNWKYEIRITSDNITLDSDLYDALTEKQKENWSAFSPTGLAKIDYQLIRRSQTDKEKKLTVELHDAAALYRRFPYPLKNLTGRIFFNRDDVILSNVSSQVNERKITLNGKVIAHSTNKPKYDISIRMDNIPLDSTLEAALPNRQRNLYNQFHPVGLADGYIEVSTKNSTSPDFKADMSFKKASLTSDKFPMPITDISAKATFTPELITVKKFSGQYGQAPISLSGQLWPDQTAQQCLYRLSLNLDQVQLNEHFFRLLPEPLKETVGVLKPQGKVNLNAELNKESLTDFPDYKITVECLGNNAAVTHFPYPLKDITGKLTIDANSIKLNGISATLADNVKTKMDSATMTLNGELTLADSNFNSAILQLWAKDISFNERLAQVLPQCFQPLYGNLSPNGRFDLDFENIRLYREDDGQKSIDFDGAITLKDCGFKISGAKTKWNAILETEGLYKTGQGLSECQTTLTEGNLKIHGISLTDLKANIYHDPNIEKWFTDNLIADCYGGKITGKFEFKQSAEGPAEHLLQVAFNNIDLRQLLSDTNLEESADTERTSGKMKGSLSINSHLGDSSSRIGTCKLTISDMRVGKLSPLATLLQVLNLTEPKDYAFDKIFVDSYIKRNGLLVKKLDLSGRSLAFYGSGWMDLKTRNIDLVLTARGQRLATAAPSVLQSLTEGLGQAVVRMEVTGNCYNPKIATKTLPVIEETLQIIGTPATTD